MISAISGNDSPSPTPAPASIPNIKNISKMDLKILLKGKLSLTKIDPKVRGVDGLRVDAIANATAGRAYIAHPLKPQ